MSPPRSDGLLHVTLTAKHNVQEHQKKMRVIEVSHCTTHSKLCIFHFPVVLLFQSSHAGLKLIVARGIPQPGKIRKKNYLLSSHLKIFLTIFSKKDYIGKDCSIN